jgi:hypothetical protein
VLKIFLVIQQEYPEKIKDTIEKPEVQMLIPMQPVTLLRPGHPHPGLDINIVIHAFHVRIGVVHDVVLHIPHKAVAAKDIQRKRRQDIDPFIFGKTAVCAVMHHVEPDRRDYPAKQDTLYNAPKGIRSKENEVDVNKDKAHHQDDRLYEKTVVSGLRLSNFLKIVADPFLQLGMKRLRAGRKLWQRRGQRHD